MSPPRVEIFALINQDVSDELSFQLRNDFPTVLLWIALDRFAGKSQPCVVKQGQ